jgi:hypothetical protein
MCSRTDDSDAEENSGCGVSSLKPSVNYRRPIYCGTPFASEASVTNKLLIIILSLMHGH